MEEYEEIYSEENQAWVYADEYYELLKTGQINEKGEWV